MCLTTSDTKMDFGIFRKLKKEEEKKYCEILGMLKRVFWFIIYNALQQELSVGLGGILHCRGFAAMISSSPSVHTPQK